MDIPYCRPAGGLKMMIFKIKTVSLSFRKVYYLQHSNMNEYTYDTNLSIVIQHDNVFWFFKKMYIDDSNNNSFCQFLTHHTETPCNNCTIAYVLTFLFSGSAFRKRAFIKAIAFF